MRTFKIVVHPYEPRVPKLRRFEVKEKVGLTQGYFKPTWVTREWCDTLEDARNYALSREEKVNYKGEFYRDGTPVAKGDEVDSPQFSNK